MMVQNSGTAETTVNPAAGPYEGQPVAGRMDVPAHHEVAPPGLSATPNLASLLRSLRRRWMAAFTLSVLLSMVAGVAAFSLLSPSYTAFSQIKVLPYDPVLITKDIVQSGAPGSYMKSQAAYLKSRTILQKALKDEKLRAFDLEGKIPEPADYLEKNLVIEFQETSELITVKFSADDPSKAKAIVQAITDAYKDYFDYNESKLRTKRMDDLVNARTKMLREIIEKKDSLRDSKINRAGMTKEAMERQREEWNLYLRELRANRLELNKEIGALKAKLASQEMRRDILIKYDINDSAVDKAVEDDPVGRDLNKKISAAKILVKQFEDRLISKTPTWVAAEAKLVKYQQELKDRKEQLRKELQHKVETSTEQDINLTTDLVEKQLKSLKAQEKENSEEYTKISNQLAELKGNTSDIEQIQQEIVQKEHMVDSLTTTLHKLQVDLTAPMRVTILQDADVQGKDSKKQILAAAASPVGVTFIVCMGVAWGDFRRRRVNSASEVAQGLGMRVLGVIPETLQLEQHVLDVDTAPERHGQSVMEWIDGIRTVVLHDSQADGTKVILVASADSREGKSTVAGHLAASLARAGRRTILIDGDLRRPFLHEMFGVPMQPGLSEVILGEVDLAEGINETPEENLVVMPSGQWDRQVIQALARDGLSQLLLRLRQSYDYVIIDSHPILDATDALLMSKQADAVILTAIKQNTQLPRLYTASQRLAALHVKVLGVVVNGVDPYEVLTSASIPAVAGVAA